MLSDTDKEYLKQIILDHAGTIESGLIRLADAIPDRDTAELEEAIRFNGEEIRRGLCIVADAIRLFAGHFEKD